MIIKLRRSLIAAEFRAGGPHQPTPEEILSTQEARARAAV
jgi:hypothetical protein